jgi:hypothetical protein
MTDLERLVKAYYEDAELPEARIDAILADAPPRAMPERVWYMRIAAVAATLVIGFGFLHFYLTERDTTTRVLAEIAMNHKKQLAVEVTADTFVDIGRALERLEFDVPRPERLLGGFDLLGGRYCSIHGNLAAQLKLRDPETGAVHTLYVTDLSAGLAGVAEGTANHDGVDITLWHEDEIFFGLASDPAQSFLMLD